MAETQAAAKKNAAKKPNIFKRMGRKIKEIFSELKKVTWPTFGTTLKQLGVVIAVVLVFLVLITGGDSLLGWLVSLVTA